MVSIIYTSGTTGNPKGVVLSHRNFLQNVAANTPRIGLRPGNGDTTLVLLPPWHVFERAFEFCALSQGATFVFSSLKTFSAHLERERPEVLISVPRLWESIYEKLGKHLAAQPRARGGVLDRLVNLERLHLISTGYLQGLATSPTAAAALSGRRPRGSSTPRAPGCWCPCTSRRGPSSSRSG